MFLIWLWISNLALLLGATYNVALAKGLTSAFGLQRDFRGERTVRIPH